PHLVKDVYIVEKLNGGEFEVAHLDQTYKTLESCDWPEQLPDLKDELARHVDEQRRFQRTRNMRFVSSNSPTVIAPLAPGLVASSGREGTRWTRIVPPEEPAGWAIVEFDQDYITRVVLPTLVNRYLAALENGEFHAVVVTHNAEKAVVYKSDAAWNSKLLA